MLKSLEEWKRMQRRYEEESSSFHPVYTRAMIDLLEEQQREIDQLKAEKLVLSHYKYLYEQAKY